MGKLIVLEKNWRLESLTGQVPEVLGSGIPGWCLEGSHAPSPHTLLPKVCKASKRPVSVLLKCCLTGNWTRSPEPTPDTQGVIITYPIRNIQTLCISSSKVGRRDSQAEQLASHLIDVMWSLVLLSFPQPQQMGALLATLFKRLMNGQLWVSNGGWDDATNNLELDDPEESWALVWLSYLTEDPGPQEVHRVDRWQSGSRNQVPSRLKTQCSLDYGLPW